MEKYRKKKKFGQNFLTSPAIPKKIVTQSGFDKSYGVLEIGAGQGILTEELANTVGKVVSVEIDSDLMECLSKRFGEIDNVKIINQDILETDLEALKNEYFEGLVPAVCANLPYYITTPIIMKLLESKLFSKITVMVQKEVASRLTAKKGEAEYGAITAVCNYYASVKKLCNVPAGAFSPPPKVDSSVVMFTIYDTPPVNPANVKLFFDVIKGAFANRRKMFSNSFNSCLNLPFTKEEICDMLNNVGLKATVRGEEMDIYDFARISDYISSRQNNIT
jgi:dimethyladenosine transferase